MGDGRMITVTDLHHGYFMGNNYIPVLENISFAITKGEWTSILGPSGTGKSTLLNCLGGLDIPRNGKVHIDGVLTGESTPAQLQKLRREKIGFVFQDFRLLPQYNVLDNVCFPLLPYKKHKLILERANELLQEVGMSHRLKHLPSELSGGEKQRVAIARALIHNPDILICDEPTGNLDIENRNRIMDIFSNIHKLGHTLIIATHDIEIANKGDKQLFLQNRQLALDVVV